MSDAKNSRAQASTTITSGIVNSKRLTITAPRKWLRRIGVAPFSERVYGPAH